MGSEVPVNMMMKLKGLTGYHLLQIKEDKMQHVHRMLLLRGRTIYLQRRYIPARGTSILPPLPLPLQTVDHLHLRRLVIVMCHLYAVPQGMPLMMIQAQLVLFIVLCQVAVIFLYGFLFLLRVLFIVCSSSSPYLGLINEIMSKGRRMTYEELCNAVLPV